MSNKLPGARPGERGITDRLADQIALLGRVAQCCVEQEVDEVQILGDLFDQSRVDAITLTATIAGLSAIPVRKRIMGGNHDAVSTKGGRFTVEAFGEMGNPNISYMKTDRAIRPFRKSKDVPGWLAFHPVEFCPPERAMELINKAALKTTKLDDCTMNVLLLHHSIIGAEHNGWVCDDGLDADAFCGKFSAVFSGHFHTHSMFGAGKNGMYLGAPLHLRIEDAGRMAGWWVVTFCEDGTIDRQFVDGGAPRFHTCQWPEVTDFKEGFHSNDYVRVVAEATAADWAVEKSKVLSFVDKAEKLGYRASYQHKPVYHHAIRHEPSDDPEGGSSFSAARPEDAVRAYTKSPLVDIGDLDPKKLRRIAREAFEAAGAAR